MKEVKNRGVHFGKQGEKVVASRLEMKMYSRCLQVTGGVSVVIYILDIAHFISRLEIKNLAK